MNRSRFGGYCLRALWALPTGVLLLAWVVPAGAGWFHAGPGGLQCGDCHVMHASENGIGYGGSAMSPPGYPKLLRGASASDVCLSCHDAGSGVGDAAPDVTGPASYETGSLKRAAGAFQAAIGAPTVNGHDLGVANEVAPGGTYSTGPGLSCVGCHDPHGNSSYRNLVLRPGNAGSDRAVTAVTEAVLTPTSTQYSTDNLRYTNSTNGLGAWCQGCHTDYHGAPGDTVLGGQTGGDAGGSNGYWFRHPTQGVTLSQGVTNWHIDPAYWFTSALSRVPVVSVSGTIPGTAAGSDNEVFCGSCHKAHGSTHRAGLIWDDPASSALEDGTLARQTCQACHNE